MSLITDQGRRERQRIDHVVAELSEIVLQAVGERELAPAALLNEEHMQPPDLVREAIWKLLDERKLEFTEMRLLRRPAT